MEKMPNCPRCREPVEEGDAFCRKCGAALKAPAPEERDSFMADMAADFQRRLKDQPDDYDALYNLGLTWLQSRRFAEAASCFRQVIAGLPEFADAYARLAVCLWQSGEQEAAREAIASAASLAPGNRRIADLGARMEQAGRD